MSDSSPDYKGPSSEGLSEPLFAQNFGIFHMEDPLESGRWTARWNAGESGGPPLNLGALLELCATHSTESKTGAELLEELSLLSLCDSPNHGHPDLRSAVARLHPGALSENVLITTGTSEALLLFFIHRKPRSVALIQPGFQLLSELAHVSQARLIPLPVSWSDRAKAIAPVEKWLSIISKEKPELILINHPHNPSGLCLPDESLRALKEASKQIGATLLGDEHYRFLVEAQEAAKASGLPIGPTLFQAGDPNSFITGSFIKCLGTPGLRIGWIVGPEKDIRTMQNIKNYTTHTVNPLSEYLARLVLNSRNLKAFEHSREIWLKNRVALQTFLNENQDWLAQTPEGGWVTCLTHARFPEKFREVSSELKHRGCFLLDLNLMQLQETGAKDCDLTRRGGFRLGLGMLPDAFQNMLEHISQIKNSM